MVRPVGRYLLVRKHVSKPKSDLILPDSYEASPDEAEWTVEAVGNKCELGIEVGDKLIFRPEQIMMVSYQGEGELFLVAESFVIGIE